ncbi:spermidine synthase [Motilibacter rhizosphaerae]|uniref:Spermidine synthase n=1 Tax=Motilibacter rhizosphaerae TaxID=598652 RepID=A0A4Q7NR21_9ACTN|nr:spermidine synthase [Motilibacter rhizosphaerae]
MLARAQGVSGELVLREHEGRREVIAGGVFLMDTSDGRSERLLVSGAVRPGGHVLVGGLGVGSSLQEALDAGAAHVTLVELEPALVGWHREGLLGAASAAALTDPRVELVVADVIDVLGERPGAYDAVCLDTDNGPDWLVRQENGALYGDAGLATALAALRPGGVLALWSAGPSPEFERRLRGLAGGVRREEVPVRRGEPDVVWFATAP